MFVNHRIGLDLSESPALMQVLISNSCIGQDSHCTAVLSSVSMTCVGGGTGACLAAGVAGGRLSGGGS